MNKIDWILLAVIVNYGYVNQRELASRMNVSVGTVNKALKNLIEAGYLNEAYEITSKASEHIAKTRPERAVILAAGHGLRMAPISHIPKALLQINGEPLIERLIRQLHKVGITDISVVIGNMMERLEYLGEKYGVKLILNEDHACKDSLHSLALAGEQLYNCYVVNSDLWFAKNPFSKNEYFSWYGVSSIIDEDSFVRINRKMELVYTKDSPGNTMVGLGYLTGKAAEYLRCRLKYMDSKRSFAKAAWEEALLDDDKMVAYARLLLGQTYYAVKTYEQLLELDGESMDILARRRSIVAKALGTMEEEILDLSPMQKGMSNRLMRFSFKGEPYVLRIPGEGSEKLVDRGQEAAVYRALRNLGIADEAVFLDPQTGYKISRYIRQAHVCHPENRKEVSACIAVLKKLHGLKLEAGEEKDLFDQILFYENFLQPDSYFTDYQEVRKGVMALKPMLQALSGEKCLCHIDAVPDNFLLSEKGVWLIDWEYAGICDPFADLAAFCVYSGYDKEAIQSITEEYMGGYDSGALCKVYGYCAVCGLMWALWSEYKGQYGVNYNGYAIKQYKYARKFAPLALEIYRKEVNR